MKKLFQLVRVVLNCIWLFFPAIIILAFAYYGLTSLQQGRDIVITIVESEIVAFFPILTISFWALLTWYSSRHVAILKMAHYSYLPSLQVYFYNHVPRYLGLLCFIAIEISIIQSRIIGWSIEKAFLSTIVLNVVLISVGRPWMKKKKHFFQKRPYIFYGLTLLLLMFLSILLNRYELYGRLIGIYFFLVIASMALLIFANSRRREVNKGVFLADRVNFRKRSYFFPVIFVILFVGLFVYLLAIFSVRFSMIIGPFNYFMLSFGVLLVAANFVSWLSIKYRINLHFGFFLLTFMLGLVIDQYQINRFETKSTYEDRIHMAQYFEKWYALHSKDLENSANCPFPVFITLADGGASRSGYWVAQVLGEIQDQMGKDFSDHLLMISGASGGSLGNVAFYNLLMQGKNQNANFNYRQKSKKFLKQDFLTFTLSRMLNPFYFLNDRANALEKAMDYAEPDMAKPFQEFILTAESDLLPILYINTTRMQDSYPALISNIQYDKGILNGRLDLLKILDKRGEGIKLSTATILSSRFPYMSPAGGLGDQYFVDGGYFDNSGAGVVHETLLAFEKFLNSKKQGLADRVSFHTIHIRNSKGNHKDFDRVNPIINDLLAPILVLAASYGQQTEINTQRLRYYLDNRPIKSEWFEVALYKHTLGEVEYSMNWYMSEDCRNRIDIRFNEELSSGGTIYDFIKFFSDKEGQVK